MAINTATLITLSNQYEYAILVRDKLGLTKIVHLDKNPEKVTDEAKQYVTLKVSPFANGKHYHVITNDLPSNSKLDISIVYILHPREEVYKWNGINFNQGYLEFCMALRTHSIGAVTDIDYGPTLVTVESFLKLLKEVYSHDHGKWKSIDMQGNVLRDTLRIGTDV